MFENTNPGSSALRRSILCFSVGVVFAFGILVMFGDTFEARTVSARSSSESSTVTTKRAKHVIWVWFENRGLTDINATTAPFFTSFAATHANFTNYFGVTHPSEPNYLDAFSGSNQGVVDDGHFSFPADTDNLAKQFAVAGKSWRLYAQDYPGGCFNGDSSNGGIDGPGVAGQYVRKHNPAISFESVSMDPVQCGNIQPLANFDPTVSFAFVVPNMINDMHDGTTAQGDAFLQAFVPLVTSSPDWAHTLLIVTFDEGESNVNGGGPIYTAAAAAWLNNRAITTTYDHFNLLRTTEDIFGLPHLGGTNTAAAITEILPKTARSDFDGDGKTDVTVYRPDGGFWFSLKSGGGGALIQQWGVPGDIPTPGDFDGDGKADIAVYRPSVGLWFILRSSDSTLQLVQWGVSTDIPVAADFDGDGKTDVAVYRPDGGFWFVLRSSDSALQLRQWGDPGDIPVVGDYDGDNHADVAIYRPNGGFWFVLRSSDSALQLRQWGDPGDQVIPGDFDGDGKTDVAVYRPDGGFWFILRSSDSTLQLMQWGEPGDIPTPGDFDGDGRDDIAVLRPQDGNWFIMGSTNGFQLINWAIPGDIPIPPRSAP